MDEEEIIKNSKHEKYISWCQILSLFASHANLNIDNAKEEYLFNVFACHFFQVLENHDQLCPECLDFYKKRAKELGGKSVRVKINPEKYEKAKLKEKLIMEELKKNINMAQTIAKFVELDREEDAKNLKHPYVVWKMENREGQFWASYTEKSFSDKKVWDIIASQEQLVGKFTILLGYWREVDYQKKWRSWNGEGFKVTKCYLLSDDFSLTSWDKKENEYLPEKSLREVG